MLARRREPAGAALGRRRDGTIETRDHRGRETRRTRSMLTHSGGRIRSACLYGFTRRRRDRDAFAEERRPEPEVGSRLSRNPSPRTPIATTMEMIGRPG